jgi:glycosyltransferase involved in cell wall biosynthesis
VLISVVIPVCDEVESLEELHRELSEVASRHDYDLEVIFVDDGSTDGSWSVIRKLADEDPRVSGIRFRANFGKAAALTAGFRAARGEFVFTMDSDLQDDPHEIPRFLRKIDDGFDLVSGWKQVRHDPWHKVFPSRIFNWMIGLLTGVHLHDHNCGMKCYRREVLSEIDLHGGMYRFAAVLASSRGFKVDEVVVHHRPRQFGHSHYGFSRIFKGMLDLITVYYRTRFGEKPQYLFGSIAAVAVLWGLIGWLFGFTNFALVTILIGIQLFATGLVAEVVAAQNAAETKAYTIAECAGQHFVERART